MEWRSEHHLPAYKRAKQFVGPEIKRSDIEFIRPIGSESSGEVHLANVYGHLVAVKKLKEGKGDITALRKEAEVMSEINHKNISMFLGACFEPNYFIFVTELCEQSLDVIISSSSYQNVLYTERLDIIHQVATGMTWLHECKVVHCNLKPGNILRGRDGYYKIGDFGFAQTRNVPDNSIGGSPLYMAPERLINYKNIDFKTDVYSFAIVSWEVVMGQRPFSNHTDKKQFIKAVNENHERPSPDVSDPHLHQLLQKTWDHDPEKRPKFKDIQDELSSIHLINSIEDETGQKFWREEVSGKGHIYQEVEWDKFISSYCNFLKISPNAPQIKNSSNALKKLLVKKNQVCVTDFGRICDTFSLMQVSNLELIKNVLTQTWFFPEADETQAEQLLKHRPSGTFLVRFSTKIHALVVSRVIDDSGEKKVIHTRIQQTKDGRVYFPGCEDQIYDNIIALVQSEAHKKLKTACPKEKKTTSDEKYSKSKGGSYIRNESDLEASDQHTGAFVLSEALTTLAGDSDPKPILKAIENWRDRLLKDCEEDYFLENKTFWLGQTAKYIHLIQLHMDQKHSKDNPPANCRICQLISGKIDPTDLS